MFAKWRRWLLDRLPELQRARNQRETDKLDIEELRAECAAGEAALEEMTVLARQQEEALTILRNRDWDLAKAEELARERMLANVFLESRFAELEERLSRMRAERDRWRALVELDIPQGLSIDRAEAVVAERRERIDTTEIETERLHDQLEHERRSSATLRGHLTRLRKRLNGPTTAGTARAKGEGDGMLDLDTGAGGVTHEPTQQI